MRGFPGCQVPSRSCSPPGAGRVTTISFPARLLHSGNVDRDSATEAGGSTARPGPCGAQEALPGARVLPGGQRSHPRGPEGSPVPPWTPCRCLWGCSWQLPAEERRRSEPTGSSPPPSAHSISPGRGSGAGCQETPGGRRSRGPTAPARLRELPPAARSAPVAGRAAIYNQPAV